MKKRKIPKEFVKNPKTLYDVIKSLEAMGCEVETRLGGNRKTVLNKAKRIKLA